MSIIVYADDVLLLSHSLYGVSALYRATSSWASTNISFNEKSHLIVRGIKSKTLSHKLTDSITQTLQYHGVNIPYEHSLDFKYLDMHVNKNKATQARVRASYAASHKCCRGPRLMQTNVALNIEKVMF